MFNLCLRKRDWYPLAKLSSITSHNLNLITEKIKKREYQLSNFSFVGREVKRILEQKEGNLKSLEELMRAVSPEVQLQRGFAIVKKADSFIKKSTDVSKGDVVSIQFYDQKKEAEIK